MSKIPVYSDAGNLIALGNASSSAAWGDITGTLSDQTDLQTALDAKGTLADDNEWTGNNSFAHPIVMPNGAEPSASNQLPFFATQPVGALHKPQGILGLYDGTNFSKVLYFGPTVPSVYTASGTQLDDSNGNMSVNLQCSASTFNARTSPSLGPVSVTSGQDYQNPNSSFTTFYIVAGTPSISVTIGPTTASMTEIINDPDASSVSFTLPSLWWMNVTATISSVNALVLPYTSAS